MKNFEIETENLIYVKHNFWLQFLSRAIVLICAYVAIIIIGFSFVYESAPVYGVSMQPNLNPLGSTKSDTVYINKFSNFSYGDIVVLEKTSAIDINHIIKRVVGMPGDTIEIKQVEDGIFVFRNGEKLVEDYIYNIATSGDPNNKGMVATLEAFIQFRHNVYTNPDNYNAVFDKNGRLVLQAEQVFVLGDNRGYSIDSSADGPYMLDDIVGKVDYIVPYGVAPFYYFLNHFTGINLLGDVLN